MSVQLFITILTLGAAASSLLTEAFKRYFEKGDMNYSSNALALIDSVIIGGIGTGLYYIFAGIPFTLTNVISLILMIVCVWIGSMIGYDKIIQLIGQIGAINEK